MLVGHHGGISFDGYTQGTVQVRGGSTRTDKEILNQGAKLSLEKTASSATFEASMADRKYHSPRYLSATMPPFKTPNSQSPGPNQIKTKKHPGEGVFYFY